MAGSFRKIDYRLRPAKHVERLMLCDTFRRLRFAALERYQYVGMGSVYFSDFSLFHRALGIKSMKSMEDSDTPTVQKRFEDNRPFSNIELLWGRSGAVLPRVDLERETILWLDYDGRLDLSVLNDLSSVVGRIGNGSFLTISVQCLPDQGKDIEGYDYSESDASPLLSYIKHVFGKDRIHPKWKEADLVGWGTARLFWELLTNELRSTLVQRNGIGDQFEAEQVVHFHYSDGAYMLTIGWIFFTAPYRQLFDQGAFSELDFYRSGSEPFKIALPLLTLRELRHLERQLPERIDESDSSFPRRCRRA
jgi:hypothetical protein